MAMQNEACIYIKQEAMTSSLCNGKMWDLLFLAM